ncbi:hypothetical protein Pst134EA_009118 [Puccinia striiformis f. sp. tritici]|uniref:hypothetical protein n=1 Tax=Puccinia striiformis f. sp. tritici TaxID=168172 RepID=UPI00200885F7|nr:hypothetical protein Pst134EA_009118 [Puccinia striiformis f. sp. tritici]KAH9468583.1 hypothetical protein Pst134EA_009118 [Puccinia striiformis f. sp. tritici]KAI9622057.1 hypothetical protein KEM48_007366 [Puccinia striiformis f. sp. tritici PST-130]
MYTRVMVCLEGGPNISGASDLAGFIIFSSNTGTTRREISEANQISFPVFSSAIVTGSIMNSYILLLPIFIQQVTSLLESSGRLLKSDASEGSHHTQNYHIDGVKSHIETQPRTLVWSGTIPTPGNRKHYVPRVIHDLDVNDQDLVIREPLITINSLGDNEIVVLENVSKKNLQVKLVNTVKARSYLLPGHIQEHHYNFGMRDGEKKFVYLSKSGSVRSRVGKIKSVKNPLLLDLMIKVHG